MSRLSGVTFTVQTQFVVVIKKSYTAALTGDVTLSGSYTLQLCKLK